MDHIQHFASPLGGITLASDGEVLTGLWFDGQRFFPKALADKTEVSSLPVFDEAFRWLDIYFSGGAPDFTPPLRPEISGFRRLIRELLLKIPYGQTVTYGRLASESARLLGRPHMSAQAVGGAVGHNPIALIVPCHRVVGAGGSLVGYAAGLDKKSFLLALEGADMSRFQRKLPESSKPDRPPVPLRPGQCHEAGYAQITKEKISSEDSPAWN